MATRTIPIHKRFPGKTVIRLRLWFATYSLGVEGPVEEAIGKLIAILATRRISPKCLARLEAAIEDMKRDG